MTKEMLAQALREYPTWGDAYIAVKAENERLRKALEFYADPRHWGISRDDLNYRVISWIGPGADTRHPFIPKIAQDALSGAEAREDSEGNEPR